MSLLEETIEDFKIFTDGKKYRTIYADPPWQFQNRTGKVAPEHKRLNRYGTMTIDEIETKQMEWSRTVGHRPFDLKNGIKIVQDKLKECKNEPVVPMYLRPSYVETNKKGK